MLVLEHKFPSIAKKVSEATNVVDVNDHLIYIEQIERDQVWLQAVKGSVEDMECIFVYGFGQGLSLSDLLNLYSNRLLFVYEPNLHQFYHAISNYDLRHVLAHPNLYYLAIEEDQLNSLFYLTSVHMQKELAFVALRYYLEKEMDVLRKIKHDFEEFNVMYNSNQNTHHFFREDWIRNSLYQIPGMLSSVPIEKIKNIFPGITAVIVASGPSLQTDMEWVSRFAPHALIISAGSSIQALVNQGISPHLAVTLDGGPINGKVFSDPRTLEAPLLYASTSYYEITERKDPEQTIHAVMSNDPISQYYLEIVKEQTALTPTPTVTGTAIQAAVWMGARQIILMGQDLSFPENKYYSDGVQHIDDVTNLDIVNRAPHQILNVHGTFNRTSDSFLYMKDSLEQLFEALPGVEFINATRNGAALNGTTWIPAEEVYDLISAKTVPSDLVKSLLEQAVVEKNWDYIQRVKSKLSNTLEDLGFLNAEVKQIKRQLNSIREWSRTKPDKCRRSIYEIEQAWGKIVNRAWFPVIYEIVLPREIADFDRQQPLMAIEQNLIRKSTMIYEHLGTLLNHIESKVPMLTALFKETLHKLDQLQTTKKEDTI